MVDDALAWADADADMHERGVEEGADLADAVALTQHLDADVPVQVACSNLVRIAWLQDYDTGTD